MWKKEVEPLLTPPQRGKYFFGAHWRGLFLVIVPLLMVPLLLPFPTKLWQWCAVTLILMALFWVTEVIPLAVTAFMPIMIFPMTGIMNTDEVCSHYVNDSVLMFLGSLLLAYSVEQSGLHVRLALAAIRAIGYSHIK